MASTVAFFNPVSPFGTLTGWEVQGDTPSTSVQRAQSLGADGDEIASRTFDSKETVSANYVVDSSAASVAIPKAGAVIGGYHVDSVSIQFTQNDFVKMTVSGHKHGGNSHAAGSCRMYTGTLDTVPVRFGCPDADDIVGLVVPADCGVRSYTYTVSCQHVDEPGSSGNWLAGDNYDGVETAEIELCDTADVAAASGWTLTAKSKPRTNTGAQSSSGSAEHHLQHDD